MKHDGHSIAVYTSDDKKSTARQLIHDNRIIFICKADYSESKEMHMIVKRILDKIKSDYEFKRLLDFNKKKCNSNIMD